MASVARRYIAAFGATWDFWGITGITCGTSETVAHLRAVKALIAEVKILPATWDETYDSVDEERKFITL